MALDVLARSERSKRMWVSRMVISPGGVSIVWVRWQIPRKSLVRLLARIQPFMTVMAFCVTRPMRKSLHFVVTPMIAEGPGHQIGCSG